MVSTNENKLDNLIILPRKSNVKVNRGFLIITVTELELYVD